MDLIISLEDDVVVKAWVSHMVRDPLFLKALELFLDAMLTLGTVLGLGKVKQELLVRFEALQGVLVFLDFTPHCGDLLIELLDTIILGSFLCFQLLLLLLFALPQGFVLGDVVMQVHLVIL